MYLPTYHYNAINGPNLSPGDSKSTLIIYKCNVLVPLCPACIACCHTPSFPINQNSMLSRCAELHIDQHMFFPLAMHNMCIHESRSLNVSSSFHGNLGGNQSPRLVWPWNNNSHYLIHFQLMKSYTMVVLFVAKGREGIFICILCKLNQVLIWALSVLFYPQCCQLH